MVHISGLWENLLEMDNIDTEIDDRRWEALCDQLENDRNNLVLDRARILTHQKGDNALRDKLMLKFDQYRIPRFTSISNLSYYCSVQREQDAIMMDRRRNAAENNLNFDQLDLRRVPDEKRNIIEDSEVFTSWIHIRTNIQLSWCTRKL